MSGSDQMTHSFCAETAPHFSNEWRRLDAATECAETAIEIAKDRKDHEAAARLVEQLATRQHEIGDLIYAEVQRLLLGNEHSLDVLHTWGLSFGGRVMHLAVLIPSESWKE